MASSVPAAANARYKRKVRNYLLSGFQLKYTAFLVGVALVVSGIVVAFLWNTSREVVAQGEKVVEESKQVIEQSRKAMEESKKLSDVVKMNIKDNYSDNPELLKSFTEESEKSDQNYAAQQQSLIRQQESLPQQQASLLRQQNVMLYALAGGLAVMTLLIGMLGIYFTHKVAGPIFKMKRLLRQVGDGKLKTEGGLRKGDELQDFFDVFTDMVSKLRERQKNEIDQLEKAMELAKASGASEDAIAKVALVRDDMKRALDA